MTADEPIRVNKWDGAAVKNAIDDAIKKRLKDQFDLQESHKLIDGRLFICTAAVLVAGFGCAWDYKEPFPASRNVLAACAIGYALLSGILVLYTQFIEKSVFFLGILTHKDKSTERWYFSSKIKKYDKYYTLTFERQTTGHSTVVEKKWSCGEFIDEKGYVVEDCVAKAVDSFKLVGKHSKYD